MSAWRGSYPAFNRRRGLEERMKSVTEFETSGLQQEVVAHYDGSLGTFHCRLYRSFRRASVWQALRRLLKNARLPQDNSVAKRALIARISWLEPRSRSA